MTLRDAIHLLVVNADQQPRVDRHGVPRCTTDECCQYDGRRCRALGFRPDSLCEPAVIVLAVNAAPREALLDGGGVQR